MPKPLIPNSRVIQLDILRGVSILLVMGFHPAVYPADAGRLSWMAWGWHRFGWPGVELFFVLSGFLIGGLLLKEYRERNRIDVRRFLLRRGFKIWPAYFVFIAFILIWFLSKADPVYVRPILLSMAPNFLHLQNYIPTLSVHTWTLAVEEHFYLALPFVLLAIIKPITKRGLWIGIIVSALSLAAILAAIGKLFTYWLASNSIPVELAPYYRAYTHTGFLIVFGAQLFSFALLVLLVRHLKPTIHSLPIMIGCVAVLCFIYRIVISQLLVPFEIDPSFLIYASHLRIDSLFFGVLLAYYWHFKPSIQSNRRRLTMVLLAFAAIAVVGLLPDASWLSRTLANRSILYLAFGAILVSAMQFQIGVGFVGKLLASSPMKAVAWIGVRSYSIYLWHVNPLRYALITALGERLKPYVGLEGRWVLLTLAYVIGTVLVGAALGWLIERQFLRLRDYLYPAHAKAVNYPDAQSVISDR